MTYRVRDAMQAVRSPMLYLRREEVEAGRKLEEKQCIYEERMQRLQGKWAELRTLSLEARVIWGEKAEATFAPVKALIGELRAEIWLHFWLKGVYAVPGATVDNNLARVAANDKLVYGSDDDEFSKRIDEAVNKVEEFFRRRLRG
jgi:hypothetical protein